LLILRQDIFCCKIQPTFIQFFCYLINKIVEIKEESEEENLDLEQVLKNIEKPPRSDRDMAKSIRLPS